MNRMVHAKGGFMVIKKYFSVSAVKQETIVQDKLGRYGLHSFQERINAK
jgi:hypothetical protein